MTLPIAPGINVPDGPSEQSPRRKQEDDGEHEHDWQEQKCSAKQIINDIHHLNEDSQHHEPGQHPSRPHSQEKQEHHRER